MQEMWNNLVIQVQTYAPRVLWAIVVFVIFWSIAWLITTLIRRYGGRMKVNTVILDLISQIIKFTLLAIGLISALGTLGVNVSALVASVGILGFAVGFAFKDVLSNLMAGMMLLYYRPFWLNDRIKVSGQEGIITDIDLRYTTLSSPEKRVLIPNSSLFTNTVEILSTGLEEKKTIEKVSAKEAPTA